MAPLPGGSEVPELERSKIMKETTWLLYCCCEGCGYGAGKGPLVAAESKQLCLRSSVSTTEVMGDDGLCNSVEILLCMTEQFQLPPLEEAPLCACFNKKCGGSLGSTKWKDGLLEKSKIMDDTFWVYYFLCGGCGVNKMDRGIFTAQFKELCCRGFTVLEPPIISNIMCSSVGKELCIWSECQMPPADPNPKIAICGWKLNKELGN